MEAWGIIMLITALLIGACIAVIASKGELDKKLFVDPKTGHRYLLFNECKMKGPTFGAWFDAIIYQGLDDNGEYYVMEIESFFDKFIKYTDWKNGNRNR